MRHFEGRQREATGKRVIHRPAHAVVAWAVEHSCGVEPTIICVHVGNLGDPDGVGFARLRLAHAVVGATGKRGRLSVMLTRKRSCTAAKRRLRA